MIDMAARPLVPSQSLRVLCAAVPHPPRVRALLEIAIPLSLRC